MKAGLMTTAAAAAILATAAIVGVQAGVAAPTASASVKVAEKADNFQLVDQNRMYFELHYFDYAPAIVLMSQASGSELSEKAALELARIKADYASKGVQFAMINSEQGVTRETVSAEMKKLGVTMPVLIDEQQLVGESLGVQKEGEVFVVNPKTWAVAYHGPIDNRFTKKNPNTRASAKSAYLTDALDALVSGEEVETARVDIKAGKDIAFPGRGDHTDISYAKDVAPIIVDKCASCHTEGGIAPFAMNSYEVIKGFAPMIRESVRTDRMPPYFADSHIGEFKNNQELAPEQRKTLIHWIEAGAQRGEGADPLKTAVKPAPEWPAELGEPDVIVELPAFNVPATGIIEYQYPMVDNPFKGDTWLKAMSVQPGDRAVVHHVTSGHLKDPNADTLIPGGSVGSYTPGAEAQVIADDAGAPVPAGGKLRYSMHYTTNGKPATDVTRIGYYLHKEKPKYVKRSAVIGDFALSIPAGEARHKEIAYLEFPADAYLYTLYPHAHYRGTHVELKAKLPDGSEEMLLSLPKYDFNWQRDYDPIEPIHIKAGTKLIATWVYDNSEHNHANPDPKVNVTWGEQSHQEMMYFRVNYRWADETTDDLRNDLQAKLMKSSMIGALDDNADNLVQISELRGPTASLKGKFAELDKNGDGGLSAEEMEAGNLSRGAFRRQSAEEGELE